MELLNETGKFIISNSGNDYYGFFFKGDEAFITRMINFCYNYGVTDGGKVKQYHDGNYYVLTPLRRLKEALIQLFTGEIILKHENIDYMVTRNEDDELDITWDETKVALIANERLEEFWSRISFENIIDYEMGANTMEYGLGFYQDAEPEMITE